MCNRNTNPCGILRELLMHIMQINTRQGICSAVVKDELFCISNADSYWNVVLFSIQGKKSTSPWKPSAKQYDIPCIFLCRPHCVVPSSYLSTLILAAQWIPPQQPSTPQENGVKFVVKSFLSPLGALSPFGVAATVNLDLRTVLLLAGYEAQLCSVISSHVLHQI
jgi:hypothetical protein